MLKLSSSLFNRPVMSLRLGGQIAVAVEPIINPHNLKIMGWWCKSGRSSGELVLLAEDVRQALAEGLAVNDEDALSTPDELVRHKDILNTRFQLTDKLVRTKRSKLGRVADYSYNEGMYVQKLYVARPLVKVLVSEDTLVIDRTQIVEINDNFILVRDSDVKDDAPEFARAPASA